MEEEAFAQNRCAACLVCDANGSA